MMLKVYSQIFQKLTHSILLLAGALLLPAGIRAETPEQFVRQFAKFKFAYHEKIQEPRVFLSSKSGDCDDFATVADAQLRRCGYQPRLFAVRMRGLTHVVCYVPETGAYLDYNNRSESKPLVSSDGSLTDIARKVAQSFGKNWVAAYEFSYNQKMKWLVNTIVYNQPVSPQVLLARK